MIIFGCIAVVILIGLFQIIRTLKLAREPNPFDFIGSTRKNKFEDDVDE